MSAISPITSSTASSTTSSEPSKFTKNNEYVVVKKIYDAFECQRFSIYFHVPDIKQVKSNSEKNRNGFYVRIMAIGLELEDKSYDYVNLSAIKKIIDNNFIFILGRPYGTNPYESIIKSSEEFAYVKVGAIFVNGRLIIKREIRDINGDYKEKIFGKKTPKDHSYLFSLFNEYLEVLSSEEYGREIKKEEYEEKISRVENIIKSELSFKKEIPEKINDGEYHISYLKCLSPSDLHYKYGNCIVYYANNNFELIDKIIYKECNVKIIIGIQTANEFIPFEKLIMEFVDKSQMALCVKNNKEIPCYNYLTKPSEEEYPMFYTPNEEEIKPKITLDEKIFEKYKESLKQRKEEKAAYDVFKL